MEDRTMLFDLAPEQKKLQGMAREIAEGSIKARAAETDRSEAYPWENVRDLTSDGLHDPQAIWRRWRQLPGCEPDRRRDGARLRRHRPHRGRGQYGRYLGRHALRQREAKEACRRARPRRRQPP